MHRVAIFLLHSIMWLENNLKSNQGKQIIAFSHQPLYFQGKTGYWSNASVAQNIMNLFSTYGVIAALAGHTHRSDISTLNGVTYFTTVSAINDTRWVGPEPYPPAGFRIIQIDNNNIAKAPIVDTFSYYTGDWLQTRIMNKSHLDLIKSVSHVINKIENRWQMPTHFHIFPLPKLRLSIAPLLPLLLPLCTIVPVSSFKLK